jgi:hypothetical protein
MNTIIRAAAISLVATSVNSETTYLYVNPIYCEDYQTMHKTIEGYGEIPTMMGTGTQEWANGEELGLAYYKLLFYTNQATGTWTMVQLYPETNTACMAASGADLGKYVQ